MQSKNTELLSEIADYYTSKLAQHGETPRGVDWNGEESQLLRFEQLSKIINASGTFSINDVGCGYGVFYEFLSARHELYTYFGIDVSEDMIGAAKHRYQDKSDASFFVSSEPSQVADYSIASGIFNVRLGRSESEWRLYLEATLDGLDKFSRRGFAFNCLTSYSDADKMRDDLYYPDPCEIFVYCKKRYSKNVALLHDYDLYEFTILVRKG